MGEREMGRDDLYEVRWATSELGQLKGAIILNEILLIENGDSEMIMAGKERSSSKEGTFISSVLLNIETTLN